MSEKKKRRRWTSSEKLRVVLSGLDGSVEVSELCRREGINPTQYYGWKKQLLSSAAKVFADGRESKPTAHQQRMESELRRAKDVIAEITADADHAEPYRRREGQVKRVPFRDLAAIGPAGSIHSSVREMAAWVKSTAGAVAS